MSKKGYAFFIEFRIYYDKIWIKPSETFAADEI